MEEKEENERRKTLRVKEKISYKEESDEEKKPKKSRGKKRKEVSSASEQESDEGEDKKTTKKKKQTKRKKKSKFSPHVLGAEEKKLVQEFKPESFTTLDTSCCKNCTNKIVIEAAKKGDLKIIEEAVKSTNVVSNVFQSTLGTDENAFSIALKTNNIEMIKILIKEFQNPQQRVGGDHIRLEKESTGRRGRYSFAHATRKLNISRGGKEGNDAFTNEEEDEISVQDIVYENLRHLKPATIEFLALEEPAVVSMLGENGFYSIVECGNLEGAKTVAKILKEKDGFGLNHLHYETLWNTDEDLTKYKVTQITKKTIENCSMTPIHTACINHGSKYLIDLLEDAKNSKRAIKGQTLVDRKHKKPIHFAAASETPECLDYLVNELSDDVLALDKEGNSPLFIAVQCGRLENVKLLTHDKLKDITLSQRNKQGMNAMLFAAQCGELDILQYLIKLGEDVNCFNSLKQTPLLLATQGEHLECVKLLLKNHADIFLVDKTKKNALIYAAKYGYVEIMRYLLLNGFDPNSFDSSHNYAIHFASAFGYLNCVKLLQVAGADLKSKNDWSSSALELTLSKSHMRVAEYLFDEEKEMDVNFQDVQGKTLLHHALESNNHSQIYFLVDKRKAKVDILDGYDNTLLHYFEHKRDYKEALEVAKFLLNHGLKSFINHENKKKQTPLDSALSSGSYDIIELFVENGAQVKCKHVEKAIKDNTWCLAGFLLSNISQTEIKHFKEDVHTGDNILHLIFRMLNERDIESFFYNRIIKVFPKELVNQMIHQKNKKGESPFIQLFDVYHGESTDVAEKIDHPEEPTDKKLIKKENLYGSQSNTNNNNPFSFHIHPKMKKRNRMFGHVEPAKQEEEKKDEPITETPTGKTTKSFVNFLRILFENYKVNINDSKVLLNDYKNNANALHYTCLKLDYNLAKFLLEKKIDPLKKLTNGANALHLYLSKRGNRYGFDFEELLLSYGLNFNDLDNHNRNCLFYLFMNQSHDPIEFLSDAVSLVKNLNLTQVDSSKRTLLHEAAISGSILCCMYLLERKLKIDDEDVDGNTALTLAMQYQETSTFPITLINKGAKPIRKISVLKKITTGIEYTSSVFYYCLMKKWFGLAYWLLDLGMNAIDALNDAISSGSYQTVFSLLSKTSPELLKKTDSQNQNVVHLIASHKAVNILEFEKYTEKIVNMIEKKEVSFNIEDKTKRTPIFYSCERGYLELTKKLIPHSNLKSIDDQGNTLLTLKGSLENQDLFLLLLNEKVDPNIQNKNKINPLLYYASQANFEMIKFLINNSKVKLDFNVLDKDGKTALHLLIGDEKSFGGYRNVEVFKLLIDQKIDINKKDKDGNPPIYYAQFQRDMVIFNLLKNAGAKGYKEVKLKDEIIPPYPSVNFEKDADELYQELLSKIPDKDKTPKPDKSAQMDTCKIYQKDGIYFDTLLNKTDVSNGPYGTHNFYKMQIIHNEFQNIYVLFNKWGRIGDSGQFQKTPFPDAKSAEEEFNKVFKSKTGNLWSDKEKFEKKNDKYVITKIVETKKANIKGFKSQEFLNLPSKIDKDVQEIMRQIIDVNVIKTGSLYNKIDIESFPLGSFSKEQIEKGIEFMKEIYEIIMLMEEGSEKITMEEKKSKIERLVFLSNQFYEYLPIGNFRDSLIRPIDNKSQYQKVFSSLMLAKDISLTLKVILSARKNSQVINPMDYTYQTLENHISPVSNQERSIILDYINRTKTFNTHEIKIFKITRKGELERFKKFENFENKVLLWHGSKKVNFVSILKRGLNVSPFDAEHTGSMFGNGIYFADQFTKSYNYCSNENGSSFLLLSEVALGKIHDSYESKDFQKPPEGFNSVKGVGKKGPKFEESFIMNDGTMIPCGKLYENKDERLIHFLDNNEYIVYDQDQVRMRYLVEIRTKPLVFTEPPENPVEAEVTEEFKEEMDEGDEGNSEMDEVDEGDEGDEDE